MRRPRAPVAGALLLSLIGPTLAEPNASALLFEAPALADVPTGTRLLYRLERAADPATGAHAPTSTVELSLRSDEAIGARQARVEIVTGDQRQAVGSFPGLVGNPVVLVILERDVAEMSRALRGSPYYIRNRIREALGETASTEPARVTFAGHEVEGWRVTVSPFAHDRHRDKLREHAAKRYEFTVSDAVPGHLYELRMVTPRADGTPLVEVRLIFDRLEPPEDKSP